MDNLSLEELEAALKSGGAATSPKLETLPSAANREQVAVSPVSGAEAFRELNTFIDSKGEQPVNEQTVQAAVAPAQPQVSREVDVTSLYDALNKVNPTKTASTQNSVQTTRDPAVAAKEAMELQGMFAEYSRNMYMTSDGIDMTKKHEQAVFKTLEAANKLKESRANSPILTYLLGDEMNVTARAELDAALQEELTLRTYLQNAKATRADSLMTIDAFIRKQVKNSVSTASTDPNSALRKDLNIKIADAATAAYESGVSNVEPTPENIALITEGYFNWNNGQPNQLMDGGLGQAIETILSGTDPTSQVDRSRPFSSVTEMLAKETPGSINHNKLLAQSAYIQTTFLANQSEKERKAFEMLKPEERQAKLDSYAGTLYNGYKEQGVAMLLDAGVKVPMQDAGALLQEQFEKYGIPKDDFLAQYVNDNKVASIAKVPTWNSDLLENTRNYLKTKTPAEQVKSAKMYADAIAATYKAQRDIIDKSQALFFKLSEGEYKFPVNSRAFKHGAYQSSGTFSLDFTNSAQVYAFLTLGDHK